MIPRSFNIVLEILQKTENENAKINSLSKHVFIEENQNIDEFEYG